MTLQIDVVFPTFIVLVATTLLTLVASYWRGKKHKLPPYPTEGMVATVLQFTNGTIPLYLLNCTLKLGSVFMLNLPEKTLTIIVTDPGLVRLILDGDEGHGIQGTEKTHHYERLAVLGPSVFTKKTVGEGWDWARKGVAPSFAYSNLYKSLDKLTLRLHEFTTILHNYNEKEERVDLTSLLLRFTLDFITTSMFGVNFNAMSGGNSSGCIFLQEISIMLKEYALKQSFNPLRFLMIWNPEVRRAKKALNFLADFTMKIITDYRASHTEEFAAKDQSILGHLMRSPYPTDYARSSDLLVFLVAGHDTTAFSLAWIILEVSRNKDVLVKLRKEIDSVNPDPSSPFQPSHLSKLEYLDNVIKEGMRLWPVAALGPFRVCPRDLTHGDYVLPKGASLLIPYFAMFRTGIKGPLRFDPDRWGEGNPELERLRQMHVPFSSGKRNCVGQNLAMLEMKLVLATTFRSFEFELLQQSADKELEWEYFLTLKPKDAIVRVRARVDASSASSHQSRYGVG